jgi:hypothetical protein
MSAYDGVGEVLTVVTDLGLEAWELPTYRSDDVVAVFDLDFIVYSSACMSEDVSIEVRRGGKSRFFSGRKEFNDMLAAHNEKHPDKVLEKDSFEVIEIVKPRPVNFALQSIKARVEGIMERLGANKCECYLGGIEVFRHNLPLPLPYKGNRKERRRPTHLGEGKRYSVNVLGAKSVFGREADDLVTQRAIQIRRQGAEAILIGEDKDAYGTYNIFTFNPKKDFEPFFIGESPEVWSEGFLGEVSLPAGGKNYKGYGLRWKLFQILTGDSSDGYHFMDIAKTNLVRAEGITMRQASTRCKIDLIDLVEKINSVNSEKELWELALSHAKSVYGEGPVEYVTHSGDVNSLDYIGILNLYYHCVHMRLSIKDDNTMYTILRKHGLYSGDFDPEVEKLYIDLEKEF